MDEFIKRIDVATQIEIATLKNDKLNTFNESDKLFDIASLTKIVSTFLILKMSYLNKLSIYDHIYEYIDFEDKSLTIKDLLQHNTSFVDSQSFEELCLIKKFQKKQIYSDNNYILLFYILKKLGGIENLLNEYFETKFLFSNNKYIENCVKTEVKVNRGLVCGIVHDNKCFKMGGISAHAGIFCSLNTYSQFIIEIFKEINFKNYLVEILNDNIIENRTLGFLIKDEQMGNYCGYFHTGFTGTSILINRDFDEFILCFTNRSFLTRDNTKIYEFRKQLSNYFFEN